MQLISHLSLELVVNRLILGVDVGTFSAALESGVVVPRSMSSFIVIS